MSNNNQKLNTENSLRRISSPSNRRIASPPKELKPFEFPTATPYQEIYNGFLDLINRKRKNGKINMIARTMENGKIELKDVRMTAWQFQGLKDFILSSPTTRTETIEIDANGIILVDNMELSDLKIA